MGCGKLKFKENSTGIKLIDTFLGIKPSDTKLDLIWSLWLANQNSYQGTGSVSLTVGPSGGTLKDQSGNYELEIPSGALANDQTITMTVLNSENVGVYSPITPQIVLTPHGLQFQKPVKLKLKYGKENTSQFAKDLASIYYIKENKQLEKIPTTRTIDGEYLIAELTHFSLYSGLYLRIEDVVADVITNPLDIRNIVDEFRVYLNGWGSIARRNYFYSFYQPTLLPFLIRANRVYTPGTNPLLTTFPNDDFDSDGIINSTDTYPFDPTNNGDETAPIVVSVTPNGSGIPTTSGIITVTFNERVSPPTLQSAIRLFDGTREYYVNFESLDVSGTIATFRYTYNLESAKNYIVRIQGVTDIFGNRIYGVQDIASFTTVDTGQPKIVGMNPTGMDVPQSTNQITITFNEAIDSSTLNGFFLKGYGNPSLTLLNVSADQKTATFSINGSLADSGFYILNIPPTVKDLSGNSIEIPPYFWIFQVEDHTPPSIYKVEPSGTAVNPDTPGQIVLYFTEPVNETSVSNPDTVKLLGGNQTPPSVTFDRLEMYGTVAYYTINGSLQQKTNYTIQIQDGISDLKGNVSTVPISFNFRSGDTLPPVVVEVTPQGPNISFKTDLWITVSFNEEMDPASLANALQISDSNGAVNYIFTGYNNVYYPYPPYYRSFATYKIEQSNLREYTLYWINISGAKDVAGNLVQPNLYAQFRTSSNSFLQRTGYAITECNGKIQIKTDYNRELDPVIKDRNGIDKSLEQTIELAYDYYVDKKDYNVIVEYNTCKVPNQNFILAVFFCAMGDFGACIVAAFTPNEIDVTGPECGPKKFLEYAKWEGKSELLKFKKFFNNNSSVLYETQQPASIMFNTETAEKYGMTEDKILMNITSGSPYYLLRDLNQQYELYPSAYVIQGLQNVQNVCY